MHLHPVQPRHRTKVVAVHWHLEIWPEPEFDDDALRRLFVGRAVLSSGQAQLLMAETEDSRGPHGSWSGIDSPRGDDPVPGNAVDLNVSWLASADLSAIDVLIRLHVVARHCGRSLWLHGATSELVELFELVGLREIIYLCPCGSLCGDRSRQSPLP
jgi:ABC-type transporter Mla MlaB component